jgi:4-aminobutyrate aminotransferase-like enzyme
MGKRLHEGLQGEFGKHPHVGDIRGGKGLLAAVELVEDRRPSGTSPPTRRSARASAPRWSSAAW